MAMTSPSPSNDEPDVIMDINTTPLIDVMLVLLVMLIITIPIQLHAVKLELPVSRPHTDQAKPEVLQIDIDATDVIRWQGEVVSTEQLEHAMHDAAAATPAPEVHLRPSKDASYATFAAVLASSRRQGLNHVAVIGGEQFIN